MGIASSILSGGIDKVVSSVGSVLDSLFTSDDEKNKAANVKLQLTLAATQARLELDEKLEEAFLQDAADLRKQITVEVQSADWFVRRSRPAAVWIGVIILGFNFVIIPLIQSIWGQALAPMVFPDEFWMVWSGLVLGYGILRTIDKYRAGAA